MKDKRDTGDPTKDKKNPLSEIAEQTVKNCEQALRTGLKMQQEAAQWWNDWVNQRAPAEDWQKRLTNFSALANDFMPTTQKRMEEVLELMEKNSRTSADLMKAAADAAQTPVIADSQAKWMEFWTASVRAVRANAEAVSQINGRAIDAWIDFVRKHTEVTEVRVPKAA
jgi:hypothetical protein